MSAKVYAVLTRKSEDAPWAATGEKATVSAVRTYNREHGWEKAMLVIPPVDSDEEPEEAPEEISPLRANMLAAAHVTHSDEAA
jgi:hypothetical protein